MTPQQIVDLLNEAVRLDATTMQLLIRIGQEPNEALANHPTIITEATRPYPPVLTMLGILEGIMAIDGETITPEYDFTTMTLTGFRLRNKREKERLEMARSEA